MTQCHRIEIGEQMRNLQERGDGSHRRLKGRDCCPRATATARLTAWICPFIVLLAIGIAAADPAPRNAETEAAAYERCMKLAKHDPAAAQKLALTWHEHGGAHPADHCAAVALIGLRQYKEAATRLEALAQAMTTAPAALRAEVFDQAGQAWGLAGDGVRAYAAAGEAVALKPNDPDLLIDLAEAAASAGFFDKAVADLDRVLKTDPSRVDALIYRASAYRALNRLDPALADVEKALSAMPNSAPGLLERGNIRRLKGDLAGARQDWQRIGQLAPGSQADMAAKANVEHLDPNAAAGSRASKPSGNRH
jgi:tetratricopeptide (TPR) repeat protein